MVDDWCRLRACHICAGFHHCLCLCKYLGSYLVHPSLSLCLHSGITPFLPGPDVPQLMKPFVFSNEPWIMDSGACSGHRIR